MELTTADGELLYVVPTEIKAVREVAIDVPSGMGPSRQEWGSEIVTKTDLIWHVRERYSAVVTSLRQHNKITNTTEGESCDS